MLIDICSTDCNHIVTYMSNNTLAVHFKKSAELENQPYICQPKFSNNMAS